MYSLVDKEGSLHWRYDDTSPRAQIDLEMTPRESQKLEGLIALMFRETSKLLPQILRL